MGCAASQMQSTSSPLLNHKDNAGIGCVLEKVRGHCCIVSLAPGGAAAASEIQLCAGDIVVQVDETEFTFASPCDQVAAALRGQANTVVSVWIRRRATGKVASTRIVRHPVPGKPIKEAVLEGGHVIPVEMDSTGKTWRIVQTDVHTSGSGNGRASILEQSPPGQSERYFA